MRSRPAILERVVELRIVCQGGTDSLVTPLGDEMPYSNQQSLIDEAQPPWVHCFRARKNQQPPNFTSCPSVVFATLAVLRPTVVQTPTASPIVAAVPRVVVTTHCRSWELAYSRCDAGWLLCEPRRFLDRAWRNSLPRATSGDIAYR